MNKKATQTSDLKVEVPEIVLRESINDYNQLCNNLESEIIDLELALDLILMKEPIKIAICDKPFIGTQLTQDVVSTNRKLQKAISTLYNIRINLGI